MGTEAEMPFYKSRGTKYTIKVTTPLENVEELQGVQDQKSHF